MYEKRDRLIFFLFIFTVIINRTNYYTYGKSKHYYPAKSWLR